MANPQPPKTNPFASLTGNGVVVLPWRLGMKLGCGYDSLNVDVKGVPFKSEEIKDTRPNGNVKSIGAEVTRVEDTEELSSMISNDTDASVSYGVVSVTASAKFMKSTTLNTYSLYYLVKSLVYNEALYLSNDNPTFVDTVKPETSSTDFFEKYGDYYVEGAVTGAEFYALLEIQTKSLKEKESLTASLDVGVKTGNLDASVKNTFTREISSAVDQKNIRYVTAMSGVSNVTTPVDTIESIIGFAADFPSKTSPGEPLYAILKPYSLLSHFGDKSLAYDVEVVETIKKSLAAVANRATFILNSVNYAISHLSQFSASLEELQKTQQQMVDILQQVLSARKSLAKDPSGKVQIPALPGDDQLPLHISSTQRDTYYPPILITKSVIIKTQTVFDHFYKGTVFTTYPEIKTATGDLLGTLQKNFLKVLTDGALFMENYISSMKALRDHASTQGDRVNVSDSLKDLIRVSSRRATEVFPKEMSELLAAYQDKFNDTKYDAEWRMIIQFINIFVPTSTEGQGIIGNLINDFKNVTDAFSLATSFWTNDSKLEELVTPNISLWEEELAKLNKFREDFGKFPFM